MSDASLDLNMRDVLARIDRQLAESAKLREESNKFVAEQHKLMAAAKKFGRDPLFLLIGAFGAIVAAVVARLPEILHAFGVGH